MRELLPIEVDDEMILDDKILPQPQADLSLTAAFNYHSLTFWAAIAPTSSLGEKGFGEQTVPLESSTDPASRIVFLTERLQELRYVFDGVPRQLRQWGNAIVTEYESTPDVEQPSRSLKAMQLESLRADLHITHLWLQSIINEEIETLKTSSAWEPSPSTILWIEREDICHRMLHVLHSIPLSQLEPNGNHLVYAPILNSTLFPC